MLRSAGERGGTRRGKKVKRSAEGRWSALFFSASAASLFSAVLQRCLSALPLTLSSSAVFQRCLFFQRCPSAPHPFSTLSLALSLTLPFSAPFQRCIAFQRCPPALLPSAASLFSAVLKRFFSALSFNAAVLSTLLLSAASNAVFQRCLLALPPNAVSQSCL